MKYVWIVKVKHSNEDVADVVFSCEYRAETYADAYRETTENYNVTVVKKEVL